MQRQSECEFDWAQAAFDLAACEGDRFREMLDAARLDPLRGDISHIDLRGMDVHGQDMRGWDLRYALLTGARVTGADLRGARFRPKQLAMAKGWRNAKIDSSVRRKVEIASYSILMAKRVIDVLSELAARDISNTLWYTAVGGRKGRRKPRIDFDDLPPLADIQISNLAKELELFEVKSTKLEREQFDLFLLPKLELRFESWHDHLIDPSFQRYSSWSMRRLSMVDYRKFGRGNLPTILSLAREIADNLPVGYRPPELVRATKHLRFRSSRSVALRHLFGRQASD